MLLWGCILCGTRSVQIYVGECWEPYEVGLNDGVATDAPPSRLLERLLLETLMATLGKPQKQMKAGLSEALLQSLRYSTFISTRDLVLPLLPISLSKGEA